MSQSRRSVAKTLSPINELVFVDANLPDYQTLLRGMRPTAKVHVIQPTVDGMRFIANALSQEVKVDAIHILSHGVPGETKLGTAVLNRNTLSVYDKALHAIGQTLNHMGELLLYACHLGFGEAGRQLVTDLASITGVTIAASENVTGVGGDWALEVRTGPIATPIVVSETVQASWQYAMAGEFADMRTWDVEGVPGGTWVDPNNPGQDFTLAASGRSVLQLVNNTSGTMFLLSDEANVINTTVTGTLQVAQGEADDDWIGFVLGYQNTDGDAFPEEYVGFTWSQGGSSPYGLAGIAGDNSGNVDANGGQFLVYVDGEPADGDPTQADVFDSNAGTANWWQPGTQYTFSITYTSAFIKVTVDGALVLEASAADAGLTAFKAGQLGFSNASQANVTFGNIRLFDASTEDSVPIANNDNYGIDLATMSNSLSVDRFNGLLANDADPDGDPFTLVIESDGTSLESDYTFSSQSDSVTFTTTAGGTYTVFGDGSFNYTGPSSPADGLQDAFTYYLQDADGLSSAATAMVTIFQDNTDPTSILVEDVDAGDRPNIIVEEGSAVDTDIATVTVVDGDPNDQHDLELVDASGGAFKIVDGVLKVRDTTALNSQTSHTITIKATDLVDQSITVSNITIQVDPNALPTSANNSASIRINNVLAFGTGDFAFSDADGDSFASLKINQTPTFGTLFLDANENDTVDSGETIQANINDIIAKADLDAGRLKYISAVDGNTSFLFSVNDGAAFQASPNTMSLTVNANSAPTGGVTLTGDTTIGSTLTADTSSLADADGLGTFTYRWEISTSGSSWSTIDGATSSTYTLLPEDVNKKVRVIVSYEDGGGASESVTSDASGDVALTTPPGARSATSDSGEVFLGGNFIELGISTLGDFGTLGGRPEGFFGTDARSTIGMSADFDGFGQGNDFRTDYFLPGGPEERWVVGYKVEGAATTGSNSAQASSTGNIVMDGVTNTSSGDTLSALISANLNEALKVEQVVRYGVNDKFFATIITLTNTTAGALDSVRYMRSFDPDNTVDVGGDFSTINTVIATVAEDGIAAVEAKTLGAGDPIFDATGLSSPVVLFSTDARAKASYFGFTNTNPYDPAAYETTPEKGVSNTADIGITMTFDVGTLAAGASTSFVYYTSLDGRSFEDILAGGLPPTGVVTISGDLTQGQTVTADVSNLADFDGLPDPSTFTYQWQQSIDGINWVDIDGATGTSLDLRNDQVGKFLRYSVSYVDGKGTSETMVGVSTTSVTEKFDATNDFNGDGSVDIFWQQQSSGEAVFWLMDNVTLSSGDFLSPSVGSPDWKIQAVGDLDGNGGPDLVWRHQFSNETAVWLMNGTSLDSGAMLPNDAGPEWQIADTADFNGDGKDDILWRHATAGQLAVWYMDGATRTGGELLNTPNFTETAWSVVAAGDFSGDGDVEILWQHNTSGQVAAWNMNGIDFVDGAIIATYDPGWTIQGAADFNQDGNLDLLWENIASGENSVWFMSGTSFTGNGVALPSVDPGWVSIV
ncbi:MAG: DUF4347 domain-containing protein [Spirulina sp.]